MRASVLHSTASATTLRLKAPATLPIEAQSISPDRFGGHSRTEADALPVLPGR
jgi:hypothetical protein